MRLLQLTLPGIAALLLCVSPSGAGELLPADQPIEQAIDHYIDARLREAGVQAAPPVDDANLLRRLTLDLAGCIPTAAESRAFIESTDHTKRVKLVDRLLAAPTFVRHQATELDTMLMEGTRASIRDYLLQALRDQRSWDRIFRELILPAENDPKQKGASQYLKVRLRDIDQLTTDVSSAFFGVNVSCARCHDHPLVPDWKQGHFFGMKSFFARTFDNGGFVAERAYGQVKFKTTDGKERLARMMFLTGKVIEEPTARPPSGQDLQRERAELANYKKKRQPPPPPRFSARARLVELALSPGQRDFFSRSIINRLWQRLYGRGLVMPVDQMHSENPPSHPELLKWLARDLETHGYDLRRLIRGLVLSQAYSRSSRWEGAKVPAPELFAVAHVRPLTPMQLATSLELATSNPANFPADLKVGEFDKRIEGLENRARGWARQFDQPHDNFQVSVTEALFFSNGDRVARELLADGGDRLVGRLKQVKNRQELIDLAVRNILSRPPHAEEAKTLDNYLGQRADQPVEACRQIVWALMTGSEFRFNY